MLEPQIPYRDNSVSSAVQVLPLELEAAMLDPVQGSLNRTNLSSLTDRQTRLLDKEISGYTRSLAIVVDPTACDISPRTAIYEDVVATRYRMASRVLHRVELPSNIA